MYRLLYISTAAGHTSDDTVNRIAAESAFKNARCDITGALAFDGVNFVQLLEGEKQRVMGLVDRLRRDRRHRGIVILSEKPVASRVYTGWAMKKVNRPDFEELLEAMVA